MRNYEGKAAGDCGSVSPSEILSCVDAGAGALARGDRKLARTSLLQAARGLYRLARDSSGGKRTGRVDLAGRLYRQVQLIEQGMVLGGGSPVTNFPDGTASSSTLVQRVEDCLADVMGCEEVKRVFRSKFLYPLRNPGLAATYRQDGAGGVLLYGLPGTGKTMLVRGLTGELGVPIFVIKPAEVLSKWMGDSEKRLAELFGQARRHPAALIFIDEIEALAPSRDGDENNGAMRRLLTQLLTELDGFERRAGKLLFVGATNRPWDVDAALLRGGRFDALAYVPLPEAPARELLLREALEGVPLAADVDFVDLARLTDGYTGAELCALASLAAQMAFLEAIEYGSDRPVRLDDVKTAMNCVHCVATPEMLKRFELFGGKETQLPGSLLKKNDAVGRECSPMFVPELSEAGIEPLRFVSARDLAADLDMLPFICYALQHVGINPVRKLIIRNNGQEESQNLVVEVALVPEDFGAVWTCNIPELRAGAEWESGNISLPLRLDRLRLVREKELAHIRITVRDKDEVLLARTEEVPVLAYNEWLFLPEFMELTAAFVQPNAAALQPVVEKVAERLEGLSGSRALPGYQQNDPEHVRMMLKAVHETLASDYELNYINPSPSFEKAGQKVRLVADTLEQRRGTCLDLAVLQAAVWEHIGLHSCLILVPGHAFMACWMSDRSAGQTVVRLDGQDAVARGLLAALKDGILLAVNSVEVAAGQSLDQALGHGRQHIDQALKNGGAIYVIDIHESRRNVTPLP